MNIITEPWPPAANPALGVRALHKQSCISVLCCDHAQEAKNRAEAVNKLESILKHRKIIGIRAYAACRRFRTGLSVISSVRVSSRWLRRITTGLRTSPRAIPGPRRLQSFGYF